MKQELKEDEILVNGQVLKIAIDASYGDFRESQKPILLKYLEEGNFDEIHNEYNELVGYKFYQFNVLVTLSTCGYHFFRDTYNKERSLLNDIKIYGKRIETPYKRVI